MQICSGMTSFSNLVFRVHTHRVHICGPKHKRGGNETSDKRWLLCFLRFNLFWANVAGPLGRCCSQPFQQRELSADRPLVCSGTTAALAIPWQSLSTVFRIICFGALFLSFSAWLFVDFDLEGMSTEGIIAQISFFVGI